MSSLKKNSLANYAGQLWTVLLLLATLPLYRHVLGGSAYGLITFFLSLQAAIFILEVGMSACITRELASMAGPTPQTQNDGRLTLQRAANLLRTFEWLYWAMACIIGAALWLAAGWISRDWLNTSDLSVASVQQAVHVMAIAIAVQWCCGVYTGALTGLQRLVHLNVINITFATLRSLGVFLPLLLYRSDALVFMLWQVAVSLLQAITMFVVTWREMPSQTGHADWAEFARVRGFVLSLGLTALFGFALGQSDRVILPTFLTLKQFGQYFFAATAASVFYRLAQPLYSALYPRFAQLIGQSEHTDAFDQRRYPPQQLLDLYHLANQALAVIVMPVAAVLAVFAQQVLWLWTGDAIVATEVAPIMTVLVIAAALSALLNLANAIQLAYGFTRLSLYQTLVALPVVLPCMWWAASQYGAIGAAYVLLGVSLCYWCIGIPLMHHWLLRGHMLRWYVRDMLPAVLVSVSVASAAWLLWFTGDVNEPVQSRLLLCVKLVLIYAVSTMASVLAYGSLRSKLKGLVTHA